MNTTPHTRRRFLRQSGVAIALPLMESLLPGGDGDGRREEAGKAVCLPLE